MGSHFHVCLNDHLIGFSFKIDLLLLGDSMTEGACVNYEDNFSANFIKKNINTITLAKGGNDFLINFATLKEYYSVINSDFVLWMHYVNDIEV